jgi:hypothetical protein
VRTEIHMHRFREVRRLFKPTWAYTNCRGNVQWTMLVTAI